LRNPHEKAWRPLARFALLAALLVTGPGAASERIPSLGDLPETFETRIPALLEDRLADVERAASALPGMDRKRVYLITLPLQNYLEDVVLPANQQASLRPRAIAWVIGREGSRGSNPKEIALLLVTYYQKDLFKTIDPGPTGVPSAEGAHGGNR